jgi:GNAT superfamily N-acetyltransferase
MTESHAASIETIRFAPITEDHWSALEGLFGPRGACGGCWCMWFRLPRGPYEAGKGDVNRARFRSRVADETAPSPGILALRGDDAVGWCAVAPREEYLRLRTTRTMRGPDDLEVWAILCLFVAPSQRHVGLSVRLIDAACRHAFRYGAPAVEAYPVVRGKDAVPPAFASQGLLRAYLEADFEEVARPSATRAVVRRYAPRSL